MKRVLPLILAIAAAVIVPATAFAQLTWNGYYRTGGTYYAPSSGNGPNAFEYGDRLRLNVSYAAAEDLFGAKFRLQGNGETQPLTKASPYGTSAVTTYGIPDAFTDSNTLQYGEAYVNLFGGVAKVSMGKLDITDYEVVQQYVGNQFFGNVYTDELQPGKTLLGGQKGNTTGGILQVKPIDNLSVAMFSRIDGTDFNAHELGFAAYYAIPDLGKLVFNTSLGHYLGASGTLSNAVSDDLGKSYLSLAFAYTGVKNLSATAGLRYDGDTMYNAKYNAATSVIAIVDYNMADLLPMTLDIAADLDFANASSYVEGEVNYAIVPQVKVRAYGEYDSTLSIQKLNFAGLANTYTLGGDLVLPAGKAELSAGLVYGDKTNLGIPLLIKANF
jgi:hypothetical protein